VPLLSVNADSEVPFILNAYPLQDVLEALDAEGIKIAQH
jgi:hypothetical protein